MNTATIREKLYDYIRVADDKKIKAIYMILEDEITEEKEWWENKDYITELDNRYKAWENGTDKAYTLAEIESSIAQLKKKRGHS